MRTSPTTVLTLGRADESGVRRIQLVPARRFIGDWVARTDAPEVVRCDVAVRSGADAAGNLALDVAITAAGIIATLLIPGLLLLPLSGR